MKYIVHRKKKIKECDGGMGSGDFGYTPHPGDMTPMGMGPVIPVGGPDRWDMGFKFDSSSPKKKYKIKRKRK